MSFTLRALTVKPTLDTPYPDDPRWTPWTRWVEPEARRAHDLAMGVRKHLAAAGVRADGPHGAVPGVWPELPAELERAAALEALARDMLSRFVATGDGHRARVGQVQIAKWQAVLDGGSDA
jgi:hypothetical protein